MKLSREEACTLLLRHQSLLPPRGLIGAEGALAHIRQVGSIQFDPLNQVGFNPQLVLQARVKGYRPAMLESLLYRDRALVDGFDKCLCIYPVEDWPAFTRQRESDKQGYARRYETMGQAVEIVRQAVAERGALCSADFDPGEKVNWPWGPTNAARAALEYLYFCGELVIHHKEGARKYYDLTSRHIPPEILAASDPNIDLPAYRQWHVLRRVGAIGMLWNRGSDAWLGVRGLKGAEREGAFAALLREGSLLPVEVEGLKEPLYLRSSDRALLDMEPVDSRPEMAFIAPLDNMMWDRRLIEALFGFRYRWEVYVPEPQRQYGYYVLPVLYSGRFVARMEPKFDKKAKTLRLLHWWWEDGVRPNGAIKAAFRRCLKEFMAYLGAKEVAAHEGCDWMGL